jgi:GntR family transcriptional regulator
MAGLTRRDGASLHHQLFSILQSGIFSGRYRDGALLPSEDSLAETYEVSRATVRRAMLTLESKGMIKRVPGVGTRVLSPGPEAAAASTVVDLVGSSSAPNELSMLEFGFMGASAEVAAQLELSPGDTILHVSRLRRVDSTPFRLTHHYLPAYIGRRLTPKMLEKRLIIDVLADLGVVPARTVNVISAILANADDADILKVDVGVPLLDLTRIARAATGAVLMVQHTTTPPEREKLYIEVDSISKQATPLSGGLAAF